MASSNTLPEGTDSIIAGAGVLGDDDDLRTGSARDEAAVDDASFDSGLRGRTAGGEDRAVSGSLKSQANEKVLELRGQATDKARDYAEQGKTKATDALDQVVRMISDTAAQVDEKVGSEYGDYARRAGSAVEQLADTLRNKDVDDLFADARDLVRRSPGLAATAAAVIGFALVRIIKAGLETQNQPAGGTPRKAG